MTRNVRTYEHFCLVARALEQVGDRWSLLVIRDLRTGPKRFTDLTERLGGITPKTLTQRLRELADLGLVADDREPGRREVWYRLTSAGSDLGPVVDALSWWGLRHAWRRPLAGEPLHAEHLLGAVTQALEHAGDDGEPARWHFRFPDDDYLLEYDGRHWSLTETSPRTEPDVTVTATTDALAQFLFSPPGSPRTTVEVTGSRAALRRFDRLTSAVTDLVRAEQSD
ncbi:MAG TPA: helix-turn-helix domain-containing protein [Pseudonocardiaceae bacterium]|nr:helix-turn-helix domain-containing protein [Pseudonocardiaceae bacterium]